MYCKKIDSIRFNRYFSRMPIWAAAGHQKAHYRCLNVSTVGQVTQWSLRELARAKLLTSPWHKSCWQPVSGPRRNSRSWSMEPANFIEKIIKAQEFTRYLFCWKDQITCGKKLRIFEDLSYWGRWSFCDYVLGKLLPTPNLMVLL